MKLLLSIVFILSLFTVNAQSRAPLYALAQNFSIKSPGGWDYITTYHNRIYVSHGGQVNILDESTGDSLGVITNTTGVHGIAFDTSRQRGYTSNGRTNTVTVFDIKTNEQLALVAVGENPDAIIYEPFTHSILTCNGRSKDLTFIDPSNNKVTRTIAVGGKPEEAVPDDKGLLYVNIEDKNEVAVVDLQQGLVVKHWPLAAEGPTGMKYDAATNRLFVGCDDVLVVLDSRSGAVISRVPIGAGCDGVAFDKKTKTIFTSNGQAATLTVIHEDDANHYSVMQNLPTKRGARTLTLDAATGKLFLPTADFSPAIAGERPRMIPGTFQVLVVAREKK
jgi:YVTN family beta-propeller protein